MKTIEKRAMTLSEKLEYDALYKKLCVIGNAKTKLERQNHKIIDENERRMRVVHSNNKEIRKKNADCIIIRAQLNKLLEKTGGSF